MFLPLVMICLINTPSVCSTLQGPVQPTYETCLTELELNGLPTVRQSIQGQARIHASGCLVIGDRQT